MAIGLASNFQIYHDEFYAGYVETIQQNVDAFNEASAGCISMITQAHEGHYQKEAFFDVIASLVTRRDITTVTAATDLAPTSDEFVGVKLNWKIGPVANTIDAWKKIGADQSELSFVVGQQVAKALPQRMLDRALAALEAKLDSVAALEEDDTAAVITSTGMIDALQNAGDNAQNIVCWVMHSKPYYDLLRVNVTDAIYRANGVMIVQGTPVTYGRPVVVTDSSSLVETDGVSSGVDAYSTLGLYRGAATLKVSEPDTIVTDVVTGLENLVVRFQGEGAFTLALRGCEWDVTNGGVNPTDAAVATATNWDTQVADNKLLPGVILKTR